MLIMQIFDFKDSAHPALKNFMMKVKQKEGVGAGACITYALLNGISKEELTKKKLKSLLG